MATQRGWGRRLAWMIGGALAFVGLVTLVGRATGAGLGPAVGIVEVTGVIRDSDTICESLAAFEKDTQVVAVVLRIDSPGGAVAPSQEIYDQVLRLRAVKPVVASLGNIAASGGYYVAAAANTIMALPGTLTGSIGVIMEFHQLGPLAEKLGVSETIVKSGPYKDIGHPLRPLSTQERTLLQGTVDDVYAQFVDAIVAGRALDRSRVQALADGRIFSGAQAKAVGLVDELGGLAAATRLAWERGGQTGEPQLRRATTPWSPWWLDALRDQLVTRSAGLGGGLLFLYGGSTPR